jgi:branched-chain amino acid transport system substrate-binding protein
MRAGRRVQFAREGEETMHIRRFAALVAAAALIPAGVMAAEPIKIGFPIPLSGPTATYGVPILQGAQLAAQEINAKGGVLGRKIEILPRDSKANPDTAVRLARELIIKDGVNFLVGTLTSAEAPAVSTVAKENKVVFLVPSAKLVDLTEPSNLHPYIFRVSSNTTIEGQSGAIIMAKWPGIKRVATIAPDYAYGHEDIAAFIAKLKQLRPDIQIVDQEWPKLGESDFTPFITAQMGKKPDAVYCALFAGDFISFVKQATPLGYFKAIHNRLADGGEVGAVDETMPLGAAYPYGIWADAYDPVIWGSGEPPAHKAFERHLRAFTHSKYGSGWSVMGYIPIVALAEAVKKAGSVDEDKVAHALLGLTIDTPIGKRTFHAKTHETEMGEFWGVMVKNPAYPFAVIKNPVYYDPEPQPTMN